MKAQNQWRLLFLCYGLIAVVLHAEIDSLINDQIFFDNGMVPFFSEIENTSRVVTVEQKDITIGYPKKWTVIIYMAADNDLRNYAYGNIKQMADLGSNENFNIVVHLDIKIVGNNKTTRLYYIEKDHVVRLNTQYLPPHAMDSGDPNTLILFCHHAITHFPAANYALIFWNHGSGPLDPAGGRIVSPAELYNFNPTTGKLELDRSIGYFDLLKYINKEPRDRGVCFDDTTGNYLTNKKLDFALKEVCTKTLHKKFDIIAFDTCFMMHIEVAKILEKYAHIMIGSQEAEPAAGWRYDDTLLPFAQGLTDAVSVSKHIVDTYKKTYHHRTDDYTQSAIHLGKIALLEKNIDTVAQLLLECLALQTNNTVKNGIRASTRRSSCTSFDEPSYKDIDHLYTNLIRHTDFFVLQNHPTAEHLKSRLKKELFAGRELIKNIVIVNHSGKNLSKAMGLSIYFPEKTIHPSYLVNPFFHTTHWGSLLQAYSKH